MFTFLPSNYLGGGHQKIPIATSVISLFLDHPTLIKPTTGTFSGKMATGVRISVVTSGIYYTFDGTAPATTGATGHPLEVGSSLDVFGWDNVKLLKFIRQGSVSGAIVVTPLFSAVNVTVPDPT